MENDEIVQEQNKIFLEEQKSDFDYTKFLEGVQVFSETIKKFDFNKMVENFISGIEQINKSLEWIQKIDFQKMIDNMTVILNALADLSIDDIFDEGYAGLNDLKWFPYVLQKMTLNSFVELEEIKNSDYDNYTSIDELIFEDYDNDKIKLIAENWISKTLTEYALRVLDESIKAYYRGEYATTVVMTSMMWEGIIYNKLSDNSKRTTKATKENYKQLIQESGVSERVLEFFDKYVFYTCSDESQVIEDVPGRHASAHSFNIKYPSKKCALNAILVTDFLLNLKEV